MDSPMKEANSRITEFHNTKSTTLDLSGLGLTTLPEFMPKNIHTLLLNNNKLTDLSSIHGRDVNELQCNNNRLTKMPLINVRWKIMVNNNCITSLQEFDEFNQNPWLHVHCSNNPITKINGENYFSLVCNNDDLRYISYSYEM